MKNTRSPLVRNRFFLPLLTIPVLLSFIGLIFIFEASSVKSATELGDSLKYLKVQSVWMVFAAVMTFVISRIDYKRLYLISFISIVVTLLMLVAVLIPGIGHSAGGANRWLDFGFFNVQPTELAKLSVIVYLSAWFMRNEKGRTLSFLTLIGLIVFLIFLQPDMGSAVIVFSLSLIIYFLSGAKLSHLFLIVTGATGLFMLLIKVSPYRFNRLLAFLNPSVDPLGISYHVNQIFISLGNGGIFGQGFGASRQKYLFLPEAHTDSIFAIIGEEYGFIGSITIIALYLVFVYKVYHLVRLAPDRLSKLLAGGIFAYFNLQFIINLSGVVGLLPITGVPLPFLSYGGSNLLTSFGLVGILLNIEKRVKV